MPLVHVVLFKFHESTPPERRAELLEACKGLGGACGGVAAGILHWAADWNRDQRKNFQMIEFSLFSDAEAFARFQAHPAHSAFGEDMRNCADWVVGNIETEMALSRTTALRSLTTL